jgi:hypothetical protein
MNVNNLIRNKLDHIKFWFITKKFRNVNCLMDIGCGNRPQMVIGANKYHYLIDPSDTFCANYWHQPFYHMHGTWADALNSIRKYHYPIDCIVLMDVIEHLEKDEGIELLQETEKLVNQIIIFTPMGFMEQDDKDNIWNTHKSGWIPSDFGNNWTVYTFPYFHWCDFKGNILPKPHGSILAVYNK